MNSQEIREALKDSKFDGLEIEWDDRRKVIVVGGPHYPNVKTDLEELGFDCSSPMFADKVFKSERKPTQTLKERYEAMTPEEKKRADDQFGKMVTG